MTSNKFLVLILILSFTYLVINEVSADENKGKLSTMFKLAKIDEEINKIPSMFGFGISEAIDNVVETTQEVGTEAMKDLNPLYKQKLENEVKQKQKEMFGPNKDGIENIKYKPIGDDAWGRDVKKVDAKETKKEESNRPWGGRKEF